jgi:hypothetical protein
VTKAREKLWYRETYKRDTMIITAPERLPILPDVRGFTVVEMQTLAAGVVLRGEERLEYQDIRVYLKEKPR